MKRNIKNQILFGFIVLGIMAAAVWLSSCQSPKQDSYTEQREQQSRAYSAAIHLLDSVKHVEELADQKEFEKTKAGKIQKKHPDWSRDDCKNLAKNQIWIGMKYEMLVYLRGKPNNINTSNYGTGIQYQWIWDNYKPPFFYGGEDGIITAYN